MKMLMVESNNKYKIYFSKMTWKTKEYRTYWGTNKLQGIVSKNIENTFNWELIFEIEKKNCSRYPASNSVKQFI